MSSSSSYQTLVWLLFLAATFPVVAAFGVDLPTFGRQSATLTTTQNSMSNNLNQNPVEDWFENFKQFWSGNSGNPLKDSSNTNPNESFSLNNNGNYQPLSSDNVAAGTTLITSIPVSSIKPGGLRLFLMFYLMGMQNTPDPNTWRADPSSSSSNSRNGEDDESSRLYTVEALYGDQSAMISVELLSNEIRICRIGSCPSMAYLVQESVLVDGILDELEQCATEANVAEQDKLLIPNPSNAIERARGALAFG